LATLLAAMWCVLFAILHLFWALGGSVGLASSAGRSLAEHRPVGFIVFGLYGVAAALIVGGILVLAPSAAKPGRGRSAIVALLFGLGLALMLRGVGLEAILAADIGGVRKQIGPLETQWSLLLWNPWFALGGILFTASSVHAHRQAASQSRPPADRQSRCS
jgi:Protein of unknown function (DUF3995)